MNKKRYPKPLWKEAGTWNGLGIVLTSLAAIPSPASLYLGAAAGVCGGIGLMLREGTASAGNPVGEGG